MQSEKFDRAAIFKNNKERAEVKKILRIMVIRRSGTRVVMFMWLEA